MFIEDNKRVALSAERKFDLLDRSLWRYVVLSALAGAYVGFGIALIFAVGAPLAADGSPILKLVMGASFGIALTLVIFAGSELFTGNNMIGVIGGLSRSLTWSEVIRLNCWSWAGNLFGSLLLAWMVVQSGVLSKGPQTQFISDVATMKMSLPAWELFFRGVLCNWLVCLAVWMSGRTTNDAAKIMLICWCLFAFIGTGFEHSVANQSLLAMSLFLPHGQAVTWEGYWYNQFYVVVGNLIGGGLFVGGTYWLVNPYTAVRKEVPEIAPVGSVQEAC